MTVHTDTFLDRIVERTVADLPERKEQVPIAQLERRASERGAAVSFERALRGPSLGVIAEIKRSSPSKGIIASEIDVAELAGDYLEAGASAISVLTDGPFFSGSVNDLEQVSQLAHAHPTPRPTLRKDFLVDPYQVVEARAFGADAVLLIVSLLPRPTLRRMLAEVHWFGMQALVEVHDESEVEVAIQAGARIIGINNRDLKTFEVDLATTERLAPLIPADRLIVAESGIHSGEDARRLSAAGAHSLLVGESLMRSNDRRAAIQDLRS